MTKTTKAQANPSVRRNLITANLNRPRTGINHQLTLGTKSVRLRMGHPRSATNHDIPSTGVNRDLSPSLISYTAEADSGLLLSICLMLPNICSKNPIRWRHSSSNIGKTIRIAITIGIHSSSQNDIST